MGAARNIFPLHLIGLATKDPWSWIFPLLAGPEFSMQVTGGPRTWRRAFAPVTGTAVAIPAKLSSTRPCRRRWCASLGLWRGHSVALRGHEARPAIGKSILMCPPIASAPSRHPRARFYLRHAFSRTGSRPWSGMHAACHMRHDVALRNWRRVTSGARCNHKCNRRCNRGGNEI